MWNPLSWVMEMAAIMAIALAIGSGKPPDWQDFVGIVVLLVINSTISFIEENNADNVAAVLQLLWLAWLQKRRCSESQSVMLPTLSDGEWMVVVFQILEIALVLNFWIELEGLLLDFRARGADASSTFTFSSFSSLVPGESFPTVSADLVLEADGAETCLCKMQGLGSQHQDISKDRTSTS
ncbi:hypothetical protein ZIOFF_062508 [Zingiber officinale]|uniref:Uncharacterized protein n=1 Tax=Zingiber officinale TaxID=94328 RepID=A0A8J5KJA5_ZINOF|nr:hypothetical protein ZIOFF_062508 [Zingiber officinale]